MSITSAFAFGFDPKYCASGCTRTWQQNPLLQQRRHPTYQAQLGFRLAMSIAAVDLAQARALIDRGVSSMPIGTSPAGRHRVLHSHQTMRWQ